MPIKTIVVALALDDDSKRVAERAVQLANQHHAQLVGVHVLENLPLHDASLPTSIKPGALAGMIEAQCLRELQSLLGAAEQAPILRVEAGKPHDLIESLLLSHRADLLVVGPGVAKGVREKVFGSTADRVVRCAPCAVLVVRKEASGPYRHIAIGVDFSGHAQAAASWAARVSPAASREFVHAFDIPLAFEQAMLKAGTPAIEIDRYRTVKARAARQQLMKMLGDKGWLSAARVRIIRGEPAVTLIRASRRRTTDLVALGTQGANAMAQHLLGSVARRVLTAAGCDVLVVPATVTQEALG